MILLIANIINVKQPEIYQKLIKIVSRKEKHKKFFQNTNKVNQLEYREQPEFKEDDYEFRKIRNMMSRKRSVKI